MAFITNTDLGRLETADEKVRRNIKINEMVATGVTDGVKRRGAELWIIDRTWTTLEAANEWLAFINSYIPGPISATVRES